MKKTLLALALSLIMIVSLALTVYASNTISYTVQSTTAGRGDTVELIVTASNATQVKSMGIKIAYNKEALEYIGSEWTLPAGYMMATPWTETQDAAALYMAPTDVSGNIFKMKFRVKDTAALDSVAAVNVTVVAKNGSTTFPSNVVQNGSIAISCPHTNTEPRAEVPAGCNVPGLTAGVYCLGCQKYISGGQATNPTGNHADADGKWETDGDKHWHTCSCGQIIDEAAHTGGTATCVAKKECSVCSAKYGTVDESAHKKGELQKDADNHWYVCDNGCGNPIEKAAHADSTKQVATEDYLKNPEATCTQKLEYYYACTVCEAKTTSTWTSETFGTAHTYDTHNDAQPEVHKKDEELKASVAAHYICACGKYFTEARVETTLDALTDNKPQHDDIGGYNHNTDKHWKTCKVCGLEHIAQAEDHAFANAEDMICDTCGYDRSCTHPDGLEFVKAVAPTCTENGSKEYWECKKCSAKFAENSTSSTKLGDVTDPKLGHAPADTYTTDEASHWKECTRENCGIVLEDTKAKHDGEATCVAKAKCSVCDKEYGEINKENHKPGALDHDAEYHWNKCDNLCGEKLNEKKHEGGTATCDDKPVCSTCNVEYGAALGHAFSDTLEAKGAEGHGYKCNNGCGEYKDFADHDGTGEICEDCGYVYHTCGADTVTFVPAVSGTCLKKGYSAHYKCSDAKCGKLYYDAAATRIINSLTEIQSYGAHNCSTISAIPATCTTNGATESMTCRTCGMQFITSTVIPATGHKWGEWTTTLEPTDLVAGSKSRTCPACNEVETASIPALGHEHTVVEIPAVAPTCAATGLTAGSKCATCEEILVAQEVVPAIEHGSIQHVGANAATSTEAGNVEHWQCTDCETVWLDEERTTVVPKEEVIIPVIPETEPEETTQAPEETTAAPEETTQAPEETTAAPEETTEAPEETTAAPEETTQAPEDITVPEETTEAPVETTEAPEETTAAPEETTSPEVPSTGDNAIFFIVALIAFSAIFAFAVALGKKRNEN